MRYLALAANYDGTIATDGHAAASALEAVGNVRRSGRRAILVTGRRLDDWLTAFPQAELFDYVVAENGALAYSPQTGEQTQYQAWEIDRC